MHPSTSELNTSHQLYQSTTRMKGIIVSAKYVCAAVNTCKLITYYVSAVGIVYRYLWLVFYTCTLCCHKRVQRVDESGRNSSFDRKYCWRQKTSGQHARFHGSSWNQFSGEIQWNELPRVTYSRPTAEMPWWFCAKIPMK